MLETFFDTITAIATPQGIGGVGIVRVSGPETESLIDKVFKSANFSSSNNMKTHQLYYGHMVCPRNSNIIDEVLCVIMRAPNSFTGETTAEFHGHGGSVVLQLILEATLAAGARLAEPGEFSRRAFMNGRLDLSQTEAIFDIIHAKSSFGVAIAQKQLAGHLSRQVGCLRQEVFNILAEIEAFLDFPDDDIPMVPSDRVLNSLQVITEKINSLINSAEHGRILRDGLQTVILGRPNVGKSSLWNALLREERAIVTSVPGTTRDPMREYVNCRGVLLHLIDTAGICNTEDPVEKIGVALAKDWQEKADLILVVIDRSAKLQEDDLILLEEISNKRAIIILNKLDLPEGLTLPDKEFLSRFSVIETSVLKNTGIDSLEDKITKIAFNGNPPIDGEIIVSMRHKDALIKGAAALKRGMETITSSLPLDLVTIDLRECINALGLLTGENITEELLDTIFSKFCIGK